MHHLPWVLFCIVIAFGFHGGMAVNCSSRVGKLVFLGMYY